MVTERPWLRGDLVIDRAVLDDVDAHAIAAYPDESCGLLSGPASEPARIDAGARYENLANRYHAADPTTYPRTAREAYIIHGMKLQRALSEGDASGRPVKVLYHSHCDVGSYFSAEDKLVAAPDGVPVLPLAYLVTSVRGTLVDDHKLFVFDDGAWVERPFTVR